ncbi:hypothetical protein RF11_07446 [Thelohanellus kitauei]|uniref:Uncharacterized protein n=1 Tax=Thelohanellus kitauei TaxID=669202 RepID=A0A0C2MZS7_THEKT|nr:hypothetical protein RF11_07446 [Thelohanellus kitauei]
MSPSALAIYGELLNAALSLHRGENETIAYDDASNDYCRGSIETLQINNCLNLTILGIDQTSLCKSILTSMINSFKEKFEDRIGTANEKTIVTNNMFRESQFKYAYYQRNGMKGIDLNYPYQ